MVAIDLAMAGWWRMARVVWFPKMPDPDQPIRKATPQEILAYTRAHNASFRRTHVKKKAKLVRKAELKARPSDG